MKRIFGSSTCALVLALLISACSGSHGGGENAPLIVGELYTATLFGTFTLSREGVDPATISIRVMSDANALIDLVRNTHYIVEPSGNTMLITIVSLPPAVTLGRPAGYVYTFQVTYALTAGTVELERTTAGMR